MPDKWSNMRIILIRMYGTFMSPQTTAERNESRARSAATEGGSHLSEPSPSIDLLQLIPPGARAVTIEHEGQCYTLRITRANKLILTK